jgi:chemotaxis protein CheC
VEVTMSRVRTADIHGDALLEMVNAVMTQAAESLAAMLDTPIACRVPALRLVTPPHLAASAPELIGHTASVTTVRQAFSGRLHGEAVAVYPLTTVRTLRRVLGGPDARDDDDDEILLEVTDFLAAAWALGISGRLSLDITLLPPSIVARQRPPATALPWDGSPWPWALLLDVDFAIGPHPVPCQLLVFLSEETMAILRTRADARGHRG